MWNVTFVSKLNGNVISTSGGTTFPGEALVAVPKLDPAIEGTESQLWQIIADPAGSGYYVIQSLMFGYVIDIEGNSAQPGAGLDSDVLKLAGNASQLWEAAGAAFPPAVPTPARRAISRIGTVRPAAANTARAAPRMSSRLSRASERSI
jgi:hypothetical protein